MSGCLDEMKLGGLPGKFDMAIEYWHTEPLDPCPPGWDRSRTALDLAHRNYLLWHEEDKARRVDVSDAVIAGVKRKIDNLNQQRNDLIERLDTEILGWLESRRPPAVAAEVHSETPGSIVDKLSILSLKVYHMREDSLREEVSEEHRLLSSNKLKVLLVQREDLAACLPRQLQDYIEGRKVMKLYRQFKMYNDPLLNPEMYRRRLGESILGKSGNP